MLELVEMPHPCGRHHLKQGLIVHPISDVVASHIKELESQVEQLQHHCQPTPEQSGWISVAPITGED